MCEQPLHFLNKACRVVSLHDVTNLYENTRLKSEKNMIELLQSSCNHEMLAPLRCIASITENLMSKAQGDTLYNLKVISNTASFLQSQVQQNLDFSLL